MFKYLYCYFTFKLRAELQVFETDYLEDTNQYRAALNGPRSSVNSVIHSILLRCKEREMDILELNKTCHVLATPKQSNRGNTITYINKIYLNEQFSKGFFNAFSARTD